MSCMGKGGYVRVGRACKNIKVMSDEKVMRDGTGRRDVIHT